MINLKQILVPVAVVAVGVLGAFATQMSGNSSSSAMQALQPGWIDNPTPCLSTSSMCSTINTGELCTIFEDGVLHVLRGKENPTDSTCPKTLYKPF